MGRDLCERPSPRRASRSLGERLSLSPRPAPSLSLPPWQVVLICCTGLDFVLAATTVNCAVQRRLDPTFDHAAPLCCCCAGSAAAPPSPTRPRPSPRSTPGDAEAAAAAGGGAPAASAWANALKWAGFTAPTTALAFAIALFVPS